MILDASSSIKLAYFSAGLLGLIFSIVASIRINKICLSKSFLAAGLINSACLFGIAYLSPCQKISLTDINSNSSIAWLLLIEILRYAAWAFALTITAQKYCRNCIPSPIRVLSYSCVALLPIFAGINLKILFLENIALIFLAWTGILFSVLNLLILEQLYRNITQNRLLRLFSLSLALIFLFDAFLYSQNLITGEQSLPLWQIRASISIVIFTFMSIGALTLRTDSTNSAAISLSQPAVFYTTSLSVMGLILIILASGGYYIRTQGASWTLFAYTVLASLSICSIILTFSSSNVRRKINVFINKHLFHYKYDYRGEWLKLIRLLSQPTEPNEASTRAISACSDLFRCSGGAVWQKRGNAYCLTGQEGIAAKLDIEEPKTSEFITVLTSGWIFASGTTQPELARFNEIQPEWLYAIPNIWLTFPLLVDDDLQGFMVLVSAHDNEAPNWEDLDLVKTVGRQIANYFARLEQSELLAQARQFETFNKLSAFVMHDLKNLIAQQSLVVKNAEKHKDNPAFIDDAIDTIKNSVDRMNNLLRKLRQNEPEQTKVLSVKDLLVEAVKRCQKTQPVPTLARVDESLHLKADFDSLVMVFTHLIHNAQDATQTKGYIDVYVTNEQNYVNIYIEDNGEGMTPEFIRTKLFQPFESTKAGKGMGVGVYQAKEYIESLGGEISVESEPAQGSKFTLRIPSAQAEL